MVTIHFLEYAVLVPQDNCSILSFSPNFLSLCQNLSHEVPASRPETPADAVGSCQWKQGPEGSLPIPEGLVISTKAPHEMFNPHTCYLFILGNQIDVEIPGMPSGALPQGPRKGRLSYTVSSSNGAKIEVLLKGKAFRIVKIGARDGPLQHIYVQCLKYIFESQLPTPLNTIGFNLYFCMLIGWVCCG